MSSLRRVPAGILVPPRTPRRCTWHPVSERARSQEFRGGCCVPAGQKIARGYLPQFGRRFSSWREGPGGASVDIAKGREAPQASRPDGAKRTPSRPGTEETEGTASWAYLGAERQRAGPRGSCCGLQWIRPPCRSVCAFAHEPAMHGLAGRGKRNPCPPIERKGGGGRTSLRSLAQHATPPQPPCRRGPSGGGRLTRAATDALSVPRPGYCTARAPAEIRQPFYSPDAPPPRSWD